MTRQASARSESELDLEYEFGDLLPWLFRGGSSPDSEDEKAVRAAVRERVETGYNQTSQGLVLSGLNRLIEQGNILGLHSFRLFPEPAYLLEPRWFRLSPFVERLAQRLEPIRLPLFCALHQALESTQVAYRVDHRALLLLSLTLDDGWTSKAMLSALLQEPRMVRLHGRPCIELEDPSVVRAPLIPLAWASARVLGAACRDGVVLRLPSRGLPAVYRQACRFVQAAGIEVEMPRTFSEYLSAVRYLNATTGIPAIAHYRERPWTSIGLSSHTLTRLITGRRLSMSARTRDSQARCDPGAAHAIRSIAITSGADTVIDARVRRILSEWCHDRSARTSRSTIADRLHRAQDGPERGRLECLFAQWAAHMATDGRYAPRTVYQYYSPASSVLLPYSIDIPAPDADRTAWQEWYARIAHDIADYPRPRAWQSVQRFHQYLTRHHGVAMVDWDAFDLEEVNSRTDNDLVTHAEYRWALHACGDAPAQRIYRLLRIMLMLGFRAGLRFSEARRLSIEQVEDAAAPWLHVRKNEWQARLKSQPRRIPLYALLPPDELSELTAWRRTRLQEAQGDASAALLTDGPDTREPVSEARLRKHCSRTIQHATGDPSTGFHHLRHSFATWTLFALLRPYLDECAFAGVAALDDPELSLEPCQQLRSNLLVQSSGQEAIWVVTQLMGHSGTAVTRRCYIRLFDLLSLSESWSLCRMDAGSLGEIYGLAPSSCYELANRWHRVWYERATREWPASTVVRVQTRREPDAQTQALGAHSDDMDTEVEQLCRCAEALIEAERADKQALCEHSARWDVPCPRLQLYLAAAQAVYQRYRTAKGSPRFQPIVRLPLSHTERADFRSWIRQALGETDKTPQRHESLRRIRAAAAESFSADRRLLRAPTLEEARRLVTDLHAAFGIPSDRVKVLAFPVRQESARQWACRRRAIAKTLGLETRQVDIRKGSKASPRVRESVELSVQAPETGAARGPTASRRSSEAFRAVVHYLLVAHEMHPAA